MRRWLSSSRGAVRPFVLVSGGVAASAIAVVVALSGGGSNPAGTANIWVDTTGGTCLDSATAVAYSDAAACTWDQANDTCEGGDSVGVKGGSYGNTTLTGSNSRSSACTFTVASGEQADVNDFENGRYTGGDTGADWITIDGGRECAYETASCGILAQSFYADFTDRVTIVGWDIDGEDTVDQIFHFTTVTNFTVRDSRIHNACASGGTGAMSFLSGDTFVLDNNDFYNAYVCANDDPHTECLYATSVDRITFTRNRVWRCNAQGLFFTGDEVVEGPSLVENNYFGRTCSGPNFDCTTPHGAPNALHFRTGSPPSPSPDDMVIRYNTFRGNLSIDGTTNAPTSGGLLVYGNVFLAGAPCGLSNTTYSYNAHISGSCGGTGSITNASLLSNSFVDTSDFSAGGGDWRLLSGSPLRNAGNVSNYPTLDLLGITRYKGAGPDIGAYEFEE